MRGRAVPNTSQVPPTVDQIVFVRHPESPPMPSLLDRIFRQNLDEPAIPVCPDHKLEMRLRGKLGKPTRFSDQRESEYTLIYFCPEQDCNETATRIAKRSQIPVPGDEPARPTFSRTSGEYESI